MFFFNIAQSHQIFGQLYLIYCQEPLKVAQSGLTDFKGETVSTKIHKRA